MLATVRKRLLDEAIRSPELLADLAGLESYIAESYDARSFIELLQNADDATATRFAVSRRGGLLIVANNGRPFSQEDFESLCRSAASKKVRGASIGYRGIGFKSVVNMAQKVHLFSGDLAATFSRARTKRDVPNATRVPLIRIPHEVEAEDLHMCRAPISELQGAGFQTIFVFSDLIAQAIETEFASFDWTSLLFLRSLSDVTLIGTRPAKATILRSRKDTKHSEVTLSINGECTKWKLAFFNEIIVAFANDAEGVCRLPEETAVVHAFLPTRDRTGLGVKINGDLSTDPSRTRVVQDDRTTRCINDIAQFVLKLICECLDTVGTKSSKKMLAALAPISDPRVVVFQKPSFERSLLESIISQGKGPLGKHLLRPSWLRSGVDFERLAKASGVQILPTELEQMTGLVGLLKAIGCHEATFQDFAGGLTQADISSNGATDCLERLTVLSETNQLSDTSINPSWRIWPVQDAVVDLTSLLSRPVGLNKTCLSTLQERLGSLASHRRFVASLSNASVAKVIVPEEPPAEQKIPSAQNSPKNGGFGVGVTAKFKATTLKKWRSAEQHVCDFLIEQGWSVRDVSAQNLGYDIEATASDGSIYFLEVKKISKGGGDFNLTNNEMALAKEKRASYLLALVRDAGGTLEIAFISNPADSLAFERQCRQWVWVCREYPFEPETINLS